MPKRKKRQTKRERKANVYREVAEHWTPFEEHELPTKGKRVADRLFVNSRYHVFVREIPHPGLDEGMMTHLSIKRNDREVIHDWRDLQRIKNELCGPECEAIEIYPAESRLVDSSNQFHVWVFPKGKMVPFGFFDGRLVAEETGTDAKQRPFEDKPSGLLTPTEIQQKIAASGR